MSAERKPLDLDLESLRGHTPGPWSWWTSCSFRRLSAVCDGDVLMPVTQRSDGHPDVHFKNGGFTGPDARLIAAAPDLLAELTSLRAELSERRAKDALVAELIEAAQRTCNTWPETASVCGLRDALAAVRGVAA